jgi:hypothetical protein
MGTSPHKTRNSHKLVDITVVQTEKLAAQSDAVSYSDDDSTVAKNGGAYVLVNIAPRDV